MSEIENSNQFIEPLGDVRRLSIIKEESSGMLKILENEKDNSEKENKEEKLETLKEPCNTLRDVPVDQTSSTSPMPHTREIKLQVRNIEASIPNPNIALYELAYEKFKQIADTKKANVGSILIIVAVAVQVVQNMKRGNVENLTGAEKKAIVINMIKKWINETNSLAEDDKVYLINVFIPYSLDGAIDSLCQLNINKLIQKTTTRCLKWCCGADVVDEPATTS